jgi:hypothetical protein
MASDDFAVFGSRALRPLAQGVTRQIALRYRAMSESRAAVKRWRTGQERAARRRRELQDLEGARPEQAIAEALAALNALDDMSRWPSPRDSVSERAVEVVRLRWKRIQTRARAAARSR